MVDRLRDLTSEYLMTRRKDRESYMDECGEKKRNREPKTRLPSADAF